MFQISGFQINAFQQGGDLLPPVVEEARGQQPAGKSRRRSRRRYEVEVDGQVFAVESAAEAEELIVKAREVAEQQARAEAERVIKKRRIASRREKKPLKLDAIQLKTPYVKPVGEDSAELAQRLQAQLDAAYAAAARDAELALHAHIVKMQDEEDAIILLLLSE